MQKQIQQQAASLGVVHHVVGTAALHPVGVIEGGVIPYVLIHHSRHTGASACLGYDGLDLLYALLGLAIGLHVFVVLPQLIGEVLKVPRVPLDLWDGDPATCVRHKNGLQQLAALLRDAQAVGDVVLHAHDALDGVLEASWIVGVFEGVGTHQHDKESDAARPHVGLVAVIRLLGQHLRGDVCRSAHSALGLAVQHHGLRVPKVTDLQQGGWASVQQRVLQLEVTVAHARFVAEIHSGYELLKKVARFVLAKPPDLHDPIKQLSTRRILHHNGQMG